MAGMGVGVGEGAEGGEAGGLPDFHLEYIFLDWT